MQIFHDIAKQSGISQKVIERMLGSLRVQRSSAEQSAEPQDTLSKALPKAQELEIGLNVSVLFRDSSQLFKFKDPKHFEDLCTIIREYTNTCPVVSGWIGRGDFNPQKLPETIKFSHLLHASRTAGRLRAKLFRKVNG